MFGSSEAGSGFRHLSVIMLGRFGRNFAVQLLALAAMFLERIVAVGFLVQAWGPSRYSDWAILVSVAGLLQLGELGLNVYNGNVWQRSHAAGDQAASNRMLALALANGAVQGLILLLLALVVVAFVDLPTVLSLTRAEETVLVFLLLSLFTVLMVARGSISQLYRGHGQYVRGSLVGLTGTAALFAVTCLVAAAGGGPVALASAYVGCQLLFGIGLTVWDLRRLLPHLRWHMAVPRRHELASIWQSTRWLALEQSTPVLWLQMPVLALGVAGFGGPALVGFLLIRTLASFAKQVATMLSIALGVEIAGTGQTSEANMRRLCALGRLLAAVSAACFVALVLFGNALVRTWSGGTIVVDPAVAAWLGSGIVVSAIALPLAKYLGFTNRARPAALAWMVQLVGGLAAIALLMPKFGVTGAAAAMAIGEGLGMGLVLPLLARHELGSALITYYRICVASALLAGAWTALIGLLLHQVFPDAGEAVALGVLWIFFGFVPILVAAMPAALRQRFLFRWQQALDQRKQA